MIGSVAQALLPLDAPLLARGHQPASKVYQDLLRSIGNARIVCIGDGTHGTHEFYGERAEITKLLVQEMGFSAVCVEADWPDSARVNRYINSTSQQPIKNATESLKEFSRFPRWMWRNTVMPPFIDWCKRQNDALRAKHTDFTTLYSRFQANAVTFWGLDVYSLNSSSKAVLEYLEKVDPRAAQKARRNYGCFQRFGDEIMNYSFAVRYGVDKSCEDEVVRVLRGLLQKAQEYTRSEYLQDRAEDRETAEEMQFYAEMDALVVRDAEEYYRAMLDEDVKTWNLRDTHMVDALDRILNFLSNKSGRPAKAVLWAHNSHLGDARHTDMGRRRGEINLGQLCRERFGEENVFNIGFMTHHGTVTAADEWGSPAKLFTLVPGMPESWEGVLHREHGGKSDKGILLLTNKIITDESGKNKKVEVDKEVNKRFADPMRLERYVGVIYRPETERWSHYSPSRLSRQFDAVAFLDVTSALEPLD